MRRLVLGLFAVGCGTPSPAPSTTTAGPAPAAPTDARARSTPTAAPATPPPTATATAPGSAATAPGSAAGAPATADTKLAAPTMTALAKARAELATTIVHKRKRKTTKPPPKPPARTKLERVKYRAPLGEQWAYVTQDPQDGTRHPAVVWAHGGLDYSIGSAFFSAGRRANDQSASQLRAAGIVVMYPSFRGTHDNEGAFELLYGEVDDYLAAADFLRALPYVDPDRIFFAGHSTGGTLVLLAAELTDRFRAAFAFGPVTGAKSYGESLAPFDRSSGDAVREWRAREPLRYIADIRRPTFIIEGEKSPNVRALPVYERAAKAAGVPVKSRAAPGLDHFSVLAPTLEQIARAIVEDDGTGEFRW